jgi:8-amino-7-oxononanoate synthase
MDERWERPDVHGDTMAFLQYTSGSTGTPKGVVLNHANLLHNSALIAHAFEHTRTGLGVFWLPSYHDMGLIGGILQPMYYGRPNVLMSPMSFLQRPFRWLQAITKYHGTAAGGPNFAYDLCVQKVTPEQRAELDLSSWTLAFNGAEPVRPETIERFAKTFEPCGFRRDAFYPCYGLAESTLIVSGGFKASPPVIRSFDAEALENHRATEVLPDEEGARELVGCGGSLLDQRVLIVDPEALTSVPDDRIGEIWVAGPSVAGGYWRRPEESKHTFGACLKDTGEGPFLRTGDLGFLLDGELFVTGRLKDLIIIRGLNHYPQDIERTVEQCHPGLRASSGAACTVEIEGRERLVIVQEIERRKDQEAPAMFEAIRRGVAAEHELQVEAIVLLAAGSIPKTSSGKIQRHACRQGFLEGALETVAEWKAWEVAPAKSAEPAEAKLSTLNGAAGHEAGRAKVEVPVSPRPAATDIVLEEVRRVAKERAAGMTLDSSITELGLDSLERMEVVAALEDRFGARFPEHVLTEMETCREVILAVETYLLSGSPAKHAREAQAITPEVYDVNLFPEVVKLGELLAGFDVLGIPNPYFGAYDGAVRDTAHINGRELINFSSYNYLGMSGDLEVSRAAQEAIGRYGTSASASRLVSGERPIHRELEAMVQSFIGTEAAIALVGGHSTNETVLGHLFGAGDLILHDSLAHNSIVEGAKLSGARRRPFPHNDWRAADEILARHRGEYRRVCIAIEGVYSMDGDIADLPNFIELKKRHHCLLYIDEAHSLGVLGAHGRGIGEHFGVNPRDVDFWMGTLSKTLGSVGGYIASTRALVQYLKYTAPGFVFAASLPPSAAAAALRALQLIEDEPERVAKLAENARLFLNKARQAGLNTGLSYGTAVVPVITGNSHAALLLSHKLKADGINVQPILHPAVEERSARLRFFITSAHSTEQILYTVEKLIEAWQKLQSGELHRVPESVRSVRIEKASSRR